ncbi:ABC transporter ATP-binding protein [Thermorudis peleae]|mgnify:FL=1|uniref:ABC transporter ATP-binding protein n=1 Tax=Thermorudis peleae TaxID=1382356 RepID=UPI00056E880C|nr:ABC transporter ATP-binding protein [Thermorudis peleae]MBX6752786.1 ABC transporter ATP-binding protein [Thermorudis peleae]
MKHYGNETAAPPAIELEEVTRWFATPRGRYVAVADITFTVPRGQFVALVGPSGCGKSTILSMVAGLISPSRGVVRIDGQPLVGINHRAAFMFQQDALLPWKTVLDNVAFGPMLRGVPKREARDMARTWLARVGLRGFEDRYPHQLSGGMRKRVSIAQDLVNDPQILLMDEPFNGLDAQTRTMIENEVLQLWSGSNKTVLFVTHDLEEAIAMSDRVILLTAGPARIKGDYPVMLERPRNVQEVRFQPAFAALYEKIWDDLKSEVLTSYLRQQAVSG